VTPSLASDGDAEQAPDEQLPLTPQVPAVAAESPEEDQVLPPTSPPKKGQLFRAHPHTPDELRLVNN
jgi:hypothetical protein